MIKTHQSPKTNYSKHSFFKKLSNKNQSMQSIWKSSRIGNFGVSDGIDKSSVQGWKLGFGPAWLQKSAKIQKVSSLVCGLFLKPATNRLPTTGHLLTDQPITYNRPPTKCTNHPSTNHQPIRNMKTRYSITNFKWIFGKKIWDRVIEIQYRECE